MDSRDQNESLQRIAHLESMLAHQQHAYDALNAVVIEQAKTIEKLAGRLERLASSVTDLSSQLPSEPRDPLSEKPPHY